MAKTFDGIVVPQLKTTEDGEFGKNTLDALKNAADSVKLDLEATYVCSVPQKFHAERNALGRKSNRVFVFEVSKNGVNMISMPFSYLNNMFICFAEEYQPVPVEPRTNDAGIEYHRPVATYTPATKDGNIQFEVNDKNEVLSGVFAIKPVDYRKTISARYETDAQMKANGHAVREVLIDKDNEHAQVQARFTYLFDQVGKEDLQTLLKTLPTNAKELEDLFNKQGQSEYYTKNVKPYLV